MASLVSYTSGGKRYYRIVESYRNANGKPATRTLKNLGSSKTFVEDLLSERADKQGICSYSHGGVHILRLINEELGLESIINEAVKEQQLSSKTRGDNIGFSIFLIIVGRLLYPSSKNRWLELAQQTSLQREYPRQQLSKCTSQYFWDQMSFFDEAVITKIEEKLTQRLKEKYGLTFETIFYDTTNCYTYLDIKHKKSELVAFGKSKEGRKDNGIYGVSLMLDKLSGFPVCHHTYPGNRTDYQDMLESVEALVSKLKSNNITSKTTTLVFDKGFSSKDNYKLLTERGLDFVTPLYCGKLYQELCLDDSIQYSISQDARFQGLKYLIREIKLWGLPMQAVMYFSQSEFESDVNIFEHKLEQCRQALDTLKYSNTFWKRYSLAKLEEKLNHIFSQKSRYRDVFEIHLGDKDDFSFKINESAKLELARVYFGKKILITTHFDWSAEEIIKTYHDQAHIERAFRDLKDNSVIAIRPQYHWTEQKITAHVFTCYLALVFERVLALKLREIKSGISIGKIIRLLSGIRIALLFNKKNGTKRTNMHWQLEEVKNSDDLIIFKKLCRALGEKTQH